MLACKAEMMSRKALLGRTMVSENIVERSCKASLSVFEVNVMGRLAEALAVETATKSKHVS